MEQWGQCRSVKRVEIIASTISGSLKDQLPVEFDDMKRMGVTCSGVDVVHQGALPPGIFPQFDAVSSILAGIVECVVDRIDRIVPYEADHNRGLVGIGINLVEFVFVRKIQITIKRDEMGFDP